jgi:hypothetical protein
MTVSPWARQHASLASVQLAACHVDAFPTEQQLAQMSAKRQAFDLFMMDDGGGGRRRR